MTARDEELIMDLAGVGEFARLSRLSPRALRLYDSLGLLRPAHVDPESGYRWYARVSWNRAASSRCCVNSACDLGHDHSPPQG